MSTVRQILGSFAEVGLGEKYRAEGGVNQWSMGLCKQGRAQMWVSREFVLWWVKEIERCTFTLEHYEVNLSCTFQQKSVYSKH